jgi:hypothetical protein
MDFKSQMSVLVQLSLVDNQLSTREKRMIYAIGKGNSMPEKEIDEILNHHLRHALHELPDLDLIDDNDKFEYLYNIVQLMKVDEKVFLSEIRFCQDLAVKLGFHKNVVRDLSAKIFSDPNITSERSLIQEVIKKHKKQ